MNYRMKSPWGIRICIFGISNLELVIDIYSLVSLQCIRYQIPSGSDVELTIFNLLGQKVAILVNKEQPPGKYQVDWDASRWAVGIYYYRIKAGTYQQVKKMVLVR